MNLLEKSYRTCHRISAASHSNFYRSFALLSAPRQRAMQSLYAFARLADDQSDASSIRPDSTARCDLWDAAKWKSWIHEIYEYESDLNEQSDAPKPASVEVPVLQPIRPALQQTIFQYQIPASVFEDLIDGIDFDLAGTVELQDWSEVRRYCEMVASSVGTGCLSIWRADAKEAIAQRSKEAANACGIAFQITNILRDVLEDAQRGRCYLAAGDLAQAGLQPSLWRSDIQQLSQSPIQRSETRNRWHDLLTMYCERAAGHYEQALELVPHLSIEGARMFSLMWRTYREILATIEKDPTIVFRQRIQLSRKKKLRLVAQHFFTPCYRPLRPSAWYRKTSSLWKSSHSVISAKDSVAPIPAAEPIPAVLSNSSLGRPSRSLQVAVVGGGLAGIQAAAHLARHGASVTLFEYRTRLGGRLGSYRDRDSGKLVDYCQHVGMKCCRELVRWIQDTGQSDAWSEQSTLHFVSKRGDRIAIHALPLPAPLHLLNLIARWPDLSWIDRWRLMRALQHLQKPNQPIDPSELAIDWLNRNGQTTSLLENFWETILVSALGERLERVTVEAMRKVLIDGFAATRDAYHLLVPNLPLSQLVDEKSKAYLERLGVALRLQTPVQRIVYASGGENIADSNPTENLPKILLSGGEAVAMDAIVLAVPWHQVGDLMELEPIQRSELAQLSSSPITGIHTWWDQAWLDTPHAICINRFCQWIFPAPEPDLIDRETLGKGVDDPSKSETYYQVVISASGALAGQSSEEILARMEAEIHELLPRSRSAKLIRGKVVTDPNSVFSISPDSVGGRWKTQRFEEKGIFMAGDWTDTGWPATMEGALLSGVRAAEVILDRAGMPAKIQRGTTESL